jgi:hypothetical protein
MSIIDVKNPCPSAIIHKYLLVRLLRFNILWLCVFIRSQIRNKINNNDDVGKQSCSVCF